MGPNVNLSSSNAEGYMTSQRAAALRRRQVHRATGDVWRYAGVVPPREDRPMMVVVQRESDEHTVNVTEAYWLDPDRWGTPKSRSGC